MKRDPLRKQLTRYFCRACRRRVEELTERVRLLAEQLASEQDANALLNQELEELESSDAGEKRAVLIKLDAALIHAEDTVNGIRAAVSILESYPPSA